MMAEQKNIRRKDTRDWKDEKRKFREEKKKREIQRRQERRREKYGL